MNLKITPAKWPFSVGHSGLNLYYVMSKHIIFKDKYDFNSYTGELQLFADWGNMLQPLMTAAQRNSHVCKYLTSLTHCGRATQICVGNLTIIGSDNGLSPGWRQDIIWISVGLLLMGPLRAYFSVISTNIQQFSLRKMQLKMTSAHMSAILSLPQCVNP